MIVTLLYVAALLVVMGLFIAAVIKAALWVLMTARNAFIAWRFGKRLGR